MALIELIQDEGTGSRFGQSVVYEMQQQFIYSHWFIHHKLRNGKLYCDHCCIEFPANLSFWIIVDANNEQIMCHPCNHKKTGVDPYEEIKKQSELAAIARKLKMEETKRIQEELNAAANEKRKKKEQKIKNTQDKNNQTELF